MVEKKKKKLTLSVTSKSTSNIANYAARSGKTSVVIEKKTPKRWGDKKFQSSPGNFKRSKPSAGFDAKKTPVNRNIDIRKIAEEKATRRFKESKAQRNK